MRRAFVFLVAVTALAPVTASAAPAHPRSRVAARAIYLGSVALAGKRVAWDAWPRRHRIYWALPGRRAKAIAGRPDTLSFLSGSSRLLAWQWSEESDDRLSTSEVNSYFVRRKGRTKRVALCDGYFSDASGVDVSGSAVALGTGGACSTRGAVQVLDYSRGAKPKRYVAPAHAPTDPVRLAGRYVAWREFEFFVDRIVVWDWKAQKELYRFFLPSEAGVNFDLQDDGKVALSYLPDPAKAVGTVVWYSPEEPTPHQVATDSGFGSLFAGRGRIAYVRNRSKGFRFAVVDLSGSVVAEIRSNSDSYLQDFDGRCLAWTDNKRRRKKPRALGRVMLTPIPGAPRTTC